MPAPAPTGFLGSLRQLVDGLFAAGESRIQLFSAELHEEKQRFMQSVIWISAAIFAAAMTLAFASFTLVYALHENARLVALVGLTGLYATALVTIIVLFRRHLSCQPRPFADTLSEFAADRSCIRPKN